MRNKAFLIMTIKFRVYIPNAYLIRRLRKSAILCSVVFLTSFSGVQEIAAQSVLNFPRCPSSPESPNAKFLFTSFTEFPAGLAMMKDESVCAALKNPNKPPYVCKVARLYQSPITTQKQISQLLSEPKFGNIAAIKADRVLIEKHIAYNTKGNIPKFFINSSEEKNKQLWKLFGLTPYHTGGAGNPPKNLPTNTQIPPDLTKPIAINCSEKGNCCWTEADLYAISRDPKLGKDVYVQRANIQAVGAILPKKTALPNRESCSMVILSKTLAMTASHCIFPRKTLADGYLTIAEPANDFVSELDWVIWTPKALNPKMALPKDELDSVCKLGSAGEDQSKCNFTLLSGVKVIFPSVVTSVKSLQVPDIALIQFDPIKDSIPDWAFAKLEAKQPNTQIVETLTSIGFGRTDLWICDEKEECVEPNLPYGPQVGWLPNDLKKPANERTLIAVQYPILGNPKEPIQKAMPCRGDSGGGLFSGFHAGANNDQMSLVGIVSALVGSPTSTCSSSATQWVSPHAFHKEICEALNEKKISFKPFCD
jgi:hypothetical protein